MEFDCTDTDVVDVCCDNVRLKAGGEEDVYRSVL